MGMTERQKTRFIDQLRTAWRGITLTSRNSRPLRPDLPEADTDSLRTQMRDCLEGRGGEVSARGRAAALGEAYLNLSDIGRRRYLEILARDFAVDLDALLEQIDALRSETAPERRLAVEARLRQTLTAPRLRLLTQFNSLPSGVKFLVDMRADLLRYKGDDVLLNSLDDDLRNLLRSWFDIGFLDLRRITWDAPAALLEKLMDYEAVHEIRSWDDLKNRLSSDRRCYAFFHPRMPDEPLIFVQVALVNGLSDNVQTLLDEHAPIIDPESADTAIFYSITNTQQGLKGVSFGSFLIKRVVDDLARQMPALKTFATLSPVPTLRRYLDSLIAQGKSLLSDAERAKLEQTAGNKTLTEILDEPNWNENKDAARVLQQPLSALCARYLVKERQRGRAPDPVANFHLNNGARLERINWLADVSAKGLRDSAGIMVNYRYRLADVERNHEAYRETGKTAHSAAVKPLLKRLG